MRPRTRERVPAFSSALANDGASGQRFAGDDSRARASGARKRRGTADHLVSVDDLASGHSRLVSA